MYLAAPSGIQELHELEEIKLLKTFFLISVAYTPVNPHCVKEICQKERKLLKHEAFHDITSKNICFVTDINTNLQRISGQH